MKNLKIINIISEEKEKVYIVRPNFSSFILLYFFTCTPNRFKTYPRGNYTPWGIQWCTLYPEEAAKGRAEHLQNLHRWTWGHNGGRWLPFQNVAKTSFVRGLTVPQTAHTATEDSSKPICQVNREAGYIMTNVFKQLAADARAPHRKESRRRARTKICWLLLANICY